MSSILSIGSVRDLRESCFTFSAYKTIYSKTDSSCTWATHHRTPYDLKPIQRSWQATSIFQIEASLAATVSVILDPSRKTQRVLKELQDPVCSIQCPICLCGVPNRAQLSLRQGLRSRRWSHNRTVTDPSDSPDQTHLFMV